MKDVNTEVVKITGWIRLPAQGIQRKNNSGETEARHIAVPEV